jgi:uncharacterized protein (TIRG00374 family)
MKAGLLQISLGLLITAGLATLLLRMVDVRDVADVLAHADARLIPIAMAVHIGAMWLRGLVWQRLLPQRPPAITLFKASIVGFAVNYLMPVRVGELVRLYLVRIWCGTDSGAILASLVGERVLDGLAVSGILLVSLLFVPAPAYVLGFGMTIAAMFGMAAALILLASWRADLVLQLACVVARGLPHRLRPRLVHLAHGFVANLPRLAQWRSFGPLIVLAIVGWFGQFAVFYLIMFALPLSPSVPMALLGGSLANFATLLPSAPGAVGAFDAALISLLMQVQGASVENAAAYALVVHTVVVTPVVALGGLTLWRTKLSLSQLIQGRERSTDSQRPLNGNGFGVPQNATQLPAN